MHLIPDLANIVGEYLLGPRPRGGKLSSKEKRAVFGVTAAELRKSQRWYIERAREVHEWPLELHALFHHHWDPSDDEIDLGPFDEHPFHSSGDEAECSKRQPREEEELGGVVPLDADLQALEEPAVPAAAPMMEPAIAMVRHQPCSLQASL
jgi:hypothetical protein